ncbi:hypothetical protein AAZX31_13G243400 [Glycine max]|nr:hypothetical protein GLYMA_13G260600v4 [Glycine max]KAH1103443.1 hypothetical protein GYH30_037411 [Glycine max]
MDTIVSVASPIVESQFGYLMSYKENLQRLENMAQRLEDTKVSMQHRVDEAEGNEEKIEDIVQNWLKEASDTVAEAKKLIDTEGHAEAGCCMGLIPNVWTRCQLSKGFREMTQKISEVIGNGKFDRISYRVPAEVTRTPSDRGYEALDSRTSVLNEIKEALKDPKMYMIGVHGMGGVGKTTLVNELEWQVKKDGSFGAVVIATITSSPNVKEIQNKIADALNKKLKKETEKERAGELCQRIREKKNVLIILDDIWSELDLTEVGIPFGDEHSGYKLVMTSRDLNVLIKMGTQIEFDLRALQEEDSWNLFQKMAGDVVKEINIKPIAENVAKCCAGLPLLIVTVPKGLRKKDATAWKDALIQLESFDHKELQNKVHPSLELSYNFLENEELKSLFLFIGSFGINEIDTEELFSYCWGLGFYGHLRTLTKARNRYYKLINDLRASSLLLEDPECIRMHDVVCDVAKSIASRFLPTYVVPRYRIIKDWPKVDQLQKCHYIIIPWSYIYELPEKLECPELKLLVLENRHGKLKVPDNFFYGIREVRTLSLYGMSFNPFLPPLYHLINLRTLNLCGCELGDIRMVAKLTNLEILQLGSSSIEELPKEIGHLTHLRLLNLATCSKLRVIPANLISSLTCLEELYMGSCPIEWEVEGRKSESNNASLGELWNLNQLTTLEISNQDTSVLLKDLEFLEKLERYYISVGYMWVRLRSGGDHETSRILKLTDSLWTNISLTTVEDLSFANLKDVKDVYQLNDGFPLLKHLHIQESDELLHIINSTEMSTPYSAFPNLETLVLFNLSNMKEICYGPVPAHSFEKLQVITVVDCDEMKNLLLYSLLKNLSQLREMQITRCKNMKEIIAVENQEDEKEVSEIVFCELHSVKLRQLPMLLSFCLPLTVEKDNQPIPLQALFNKKVVMPKLETLELRYINTCKIWDDILPVDSCIQNLTSLSVYSCHRLTSLFSSSVTRALVRLERLVIVNCSMLKDIFVQEEEEVGLPNLEELVIKSMCDLKSIWPNQLAPNSFSKLKRIIFEDCEGFDYVFPISVAKKLRQLQSLDMKRCVIKNIVEESDSSDMTNIYLAQLSVDSCDNMNTIVQPSVLFQNLDELVVSDCHGVVNIITPSRAESLPKLRILSIGSCNKLEEIYGSKNENDAPLREIYFMKLEGLLLVGLPRLTSFCRGNYNFYFQSLRMVQLNACSMMETFCHGKLTTPRLKKVLYEWGSKELWDDDLNTTTRTIFTKSFHNTEQDWNSSSELWRY